MSVLDGVLARLREVPGPLDELVRMLLDDTLERPLDELVDPDRLADGIVQGIRSTAGDPRAEAWVRRRVRGALDRAEGWDGTLADRLPRALAGPLRKLVGRPWSPDPELLRLVLDHRAMHEVIRDVLQADLLDFARSLRRVVPDGRRLPLGGGRLGALVGVAQGVASVVGGEVERQLDGRVRDFVDSAIARSIDRSVARICDPDFAADLGAWRTEAAEQLARQPLSRYREELRRLDPEGLAADLAALLRALAGWGGLHREVGAAVAAILEESHGGSARSFLEGSGLEEGWRPHLEELAVQRARAFVATPGFARWLSELLDHAGSPPPALDGEEEGC